MLAEARKAFAGSDIAIMCAAVADYRPAAVSPSKLKRGDSPAMTLELVRNPDIAATLGSEKRPGQTLVGFALETDDAIAHGADKLRRKNLDMIVVNSLADKGAGFGTDTNLVTIITADGRRTAGTLKPKNAVAADIIDSIETLRNA
jgi:phosphopantothenoylcysteine decarboxylase/phosphopantothenate--cysteine ligase